MAEELINEILVPCPCCGRLHKVAAKDARESAQIMMPCGAIIGSAGIVRRILDAEERAKALQGRIYRLE
ncbi:MAG TPA: hypothetical protein VK436_05710 [Methanocella sp.]|nr:hypothetical protein [Methanocella sp.]